MTSERNTAELDDRPDAQGTQMTEPSAVRAPSAGLLASVADIRAHFPALARREQGVPVAYFDAPDLFTGHQQPGKTDDRVLRMLRAPKVMQAADGWIVVSPTTGQQIKRALIAAGLEDKLADLRSQPDPTAVSKLFFELMGPRVRERTLAEWTVAFAEADVPASAVMSKAEHLEDNTFYTVTATRQASTYLFHYVGSFPAVGTWAQKVLHPAVSSNNDIY
jgi:crotonobetainyl-CoA:carnitine CoA-transferase CaiB-like acyl-CoA transferase